jgi:hypothetical protein
MHDTVELFLCLACEHLNTGKNEIGFMKYWDILSPKVGSPGLTQRVAMRRLNQARVSFKHHGIMPSVIDFEGFRVTTTLFLEENTPAIFGRSFDSVSLVDVVACEPAREHLRAAEREVDENPNQAALSCRKAFAEILREQRNRPRTSLGANWRHSIGSLGYLNIRELKNHAGDNSVLQNFIDIIVGAVEALEERVELLSFGINGQKLSDFERITPAVWKSGNEYRFDDRWLRQTPGLSKDQAKWCIDFVIEVALALQRNDRIQ